MKGIIVDITIDNSGSMEIETKTKPKEVILVNGDWKQPERFVLPEDTQVVTIKAHKSGSVGGILASFSNGYVTDESWSCADSSSCDASTDDCPSLKWNNASTFGKNGSSPTPLGLQGRMIISSSAQWIWISSFSATSVWCKRTFGKFNWMCKFLVKVIIMELNSLHGCSLNRICIFMQKLLLVLFCLILKGYKYSFQCIAQKCMPDLLKHTSTLKEVKLLRGKTLNADEVLVSFDVISLFTKIPVDLAIKVARKRLRQDVTLSQRTSMPIEDIIDLLSFCLNTTYFVFDGIYYQQVFGTAMGSPVSAVIANLVMEDVEQRALASAPVRLSFWKRFVDDIISAVSRNDIDILLQHLNSIEPSIQFTVERETNGDLAFLDLNVYRTIEGKLETAVHRKPTHTDKYLSYNSHHPVSHKKSVAKTLLQRAEHLPSNSDSQANEREYVLNILRENNYPKDFLKNCLNPSACRNQNNSEGDTSIKGYAVVPYIQGVTELIKRILSNCNIKVALKPYLTLGHIFAKPKDPIPTNQKTHAVYSIPCNDCEKEYLGQSKRQFGTRLKEHQKAVSTLNKGKSALAEHVCDTKHAIAWENSKIITTNNRYGQRRCLEAWHINMNQHALNRDDGSYLPQEYLHLVGK